MAMSDKMQMGSISDQELQMMMRAPSSGSISDREAQMMESSSMPMLPPEMIDAIQTLISMGMTPDEAVNQIATEVDPSQFSGQVGALPQGQVSNAEKQMMPQEAPMDQNQMAEYLQNKVAELRSRTGGQTQMGALPQANSMPPQR